MIGIDLGTTNSLTAFFDKSSQKPQLIPNRYGDYLTPSAVTVLEDGSLAIGKVAKERKFSHPDRTVTSFKRYMGSNKSFKLGAHNFTAPELSSLVLKSLLDDAQEFLGSRPTEVVITVPAYFSDLQRQATKTAAQLSGLKQVRLLNEPTAAALAYSIQDKEEELKLIVLDLGGGTFDVSIIEKFEGVMEIHASGGDNFLGGEDFTELLKDKISQGLSTKFWQDKEKDNKLATHAERIKKQLTQKDHISQSIVIGGKEHDISISRSEFEELCRELLERMRVPILRALRDAKLNPNEMNYVVLVGGATRMPIIKKTVGAMFGQFPLIKIDPDTVVAHGAAVQSMLLSDNRGYEDRILTDVCPYTLGVEIAEQSNSGHHVDVGIFAPIIERNQPIPISREEDFRPTSKVSTKLDLNIYQGESRYVKDNVFIGKIVVPISKKPADDEQVRVRFTYDVSGILEVEVTLVSTGDVIRKVLQKENNSLSDEEIRQRFIELANLKIHPRESAENLFVSSRMERIYEESLGDVRIYLSQMMTQFNQVLDSQDAKAIQMVRENIVAELDQLDQDYF